MGESEAIPISIVDGEDTVTFYIGDESYVIKKEVAFYLVFDQRTDLGVIEGQTSSFPYTIKGVAEGDEVEVDVLNVIGTWDAEVVATDNQSGNVKVTNNGGDAKVFVYAANGRGKTDIKSLVFEGGVFTSTLDANSVSYEGGEVALTVTTNVNYEVKISEDATWLSVAPETKATHTDNITLVAKANKNVVARTATVTLVGDGVNKEFEIIQEARPKVDCQIDITVEDITSNSAKIMFTPSNNETLFVTAIEGTDWVEQFNSLPELAEEDLAYWIGEYGAIYNTDPEYYNEAFGVSSLEEFVAFFCAYQGKVGGSINKLDPESKYYAYAYCVDQELNIVSDVFIKDFTTLEAPKGGAYEDYLGRWKMGTDFIEITQKVNGSTYNVTGIKNQSAYAIGPVEASFEDGFFVLKEQKTDATTVVKVPGLGEVHCDLYLSGVFAYGTSTYGNYPINGDAPEVIFTGAYDNGSILVTPGSCLYGNFSSMGFSWVITEGENAGKGNTFAGTSLVDMPQPDAPKPAYTKWIGNYTFEIKGESFSASVSELDANSSFILSLDPSYIPDFDVVMTWDEATDVATIATQTIGSWEDPDYGTIYDEIRGLIPYNGSFTSVTGSYNIASIAYNNGNLDFTSGGTVNISTLGVLDVVGMSLFGKASVGTLRYCDVDEMIYFPITFAKANGASSTTLSNAPTMSKAAAAQKTAAVSETKAIAAEKVLVPCKRAGMKK